MKITEDDLKQAEEFTAFMNEVIMKVWHKNMIKVDREEWGKISKFTFPEESIKRPHLESTNTITDEIAKKIIEEANKACSKCKEWKYCDECEYRVWRNCEVEE